MSLERIRRGIEFDAYHALRALPKTFDGNPSDYDVGNVAGMSFAPTRMPRS